MQKVVDQSLLEAIYKSVATDAMSIVAGGEEVHPQLFFLAVEEGRARFLFSVPEEITMKMQATPASKSIMRRLIEGALGGAVKQIRTCPDIAVFISEAWTVKGAKGDPRLEEILRTGDVKGRSDKNEAIVVTLYTLDGTTMGMCPIHTHVSGKRYAEFEPLLKAEGKQLQGRLVVEPAKWEAPHG